MRTHRGYVVKRARFTRPGWRRCHWETFCRGVGLVQDSEVDANGNGYSSLLTARNF